MWNKVVVIGPASEWIGAVGPYLHNGLVPNLFLLLSPADKITP